MNENNFALQLGELDKIYEVCGKLLKTKHYAMLGEVGIHTIMARAKTLGIHPFEALNGGFFSINGKVGMSTEMMAALTRRKGHSISLIESTNTSCTLKGKRCDTGDEWTCTFNQDDAIRAQLWNGAVWKKYPKAMLYNRCMSMLFRQLFPDLSLGCGYVEDELKEITKTEEYSRQKLPTSEAEFEEIKPAQIEELEVETNEENIASFIIQYAISQESNSLPSEYIRYLSEQWEMSWEDTVKRCVSKPNKFKSLFSNWMKKNEKPIE